MMVAPHAGATAVWAVTSKGERLGICRGSKRIAAGSISLGSPSHPMAITGRDLRGDYLEIKPGQWAVAIVGDIGTYEQVPGFENTSDQEGLEDSASGTQLDLFMRVGDRMISIYSAPLESTFSCNFDTCTNRSCELVTGKKGPTGWFDLIEKCDLTDIENGHDVKSYRRNTRYVFDGYSYTEAPRSSKPSR
jgi:hypothetical protein